MIHNFNLKFNSRNCRKLLEIFKYNNLEKNNNLISKIKEKSLIYRYNKENFKEIFKSKEDINEKILKYLNFIDDFYGYTVFSDKESLDVLEALILYYLDNNLTPVKIYFSINNNFFYSLKKFSKNFNNKYNLDCNFSFIFNTKNLEKNDKNIYLMPLDNNFKSINIDLLDINHKSSIFYNFISSNLHLIKKETANKDQSSKNEFSFFPFNYYNIGVFEYSLAYKQNLMPVSIIEESDDYDLLYYLYQLCFKINFYIIGDDIDCYVKRKNINTKKSKSIAKLIGLYINLPEFQDEKMCS